MSGHRSGRVPSLDDSGSLVELNRGPSDVAATGPAVKVQPIANVSPNAGPQEVTKHFGKGQVFPSPCRADRRVTLLFDLFLRASLEHSQPLFAARQPSFGPAVGHSVSIGLSAVSRASANIASSANIKRRA